MIGISMAGFIILSLAWFLSFLAGGGPLSAPLLLAGGVLGLVLANEVGQWVKREWMNLLVVLGLAVAAWRLSIVVQILQPVSPSAISSFLLGLLGLTLMAWMILKNLAHHEKNWARNILAPIFFGLVLLYLWEVLVEGFAVPKVLLPSPSQIGAVLVHQTGLLWTDFRVTFLRAMIAGFGLGNLLGFLAALSIDRSPFFQRGLLPLGNLASAIPIVGIAPIMVMWFGFGWQSKAAVIVIMIFFPMLTNALAGLKAADSMQLDLMRSYGAGYWTNLVKLRLPAAMPFIFNALKINSTLALIGAIVAEFFGSPVAGMGFRISVEVGRLNVDIVWATIAVAALAGSLSYGILVGLERIFTHWHPSYRAR